MKSIATIATLAGAFLTFNASLSHAQVGGPANQVPTTAGGGESLAGGGAGSMLTGQDLFSESTETGAGVGQLGLGGGRFVNNSLANAPTAGGTAGAGNQQFNQSFNRLLQVQTLQQTNRLGRQFGGGRSAASMIRPTLRVGFSITRRAPADLNNSLGKRFNKLTSRLRQLSETRPAFAGVKFDVGDNGAVVLKGQVSSASAKRLAANIVAMESGVRRVTNELTVATQ